jgi:hypothetical protein
VLLLINLDAFGLNGFKHLVMKCLRRHKNASLVCFKKYLKKIILEVTNA